MCGQSDKLTLLRESFKSKQSATLLFLSAGGP